MSISKVMSAVLKRQSNRLSRGLAVLETESHSDLPEPVELDLSKMDVLDWAPAWLVPTERLTLFALICGLRPARYLEIGSFKGGSALIVAAAMKASGNPGHMYCVEPDPHIAPEHWALVADRAVLIEGFSPAALLEAYKCADAPFDFVFIDGDHTAEGVYRDATGVFPYLANGAHLLFHDSHFPDVAEGLGQFYQEHSDVLIDIGSITRDASVQEDNPDIRWGGFRLMRLVR